MCRKLDLKPNGHLFEVAQANGWGFPRYMLSDSKRVPWGWLFTMKVSVHGVEAVATGPTWKAAKHNAAAKMLEVVGFECPSYNPLLDKKDNVSTTPQANLVNKEQVEEEDLMKNTTFLNSESCLSQAHQDLCSSPNIIIEEFVEYLDDASVPCETEPVVDSISLCDILLEIQTGSEEQGLCETRDKDTDPDTDPETETNLTPEIVGLEMCSEPEYEMEDVPPEEETEVLENMTTPGSDQNHTSEQDLGMSEANISSQKEPTSSQILEGPPVACFIIRALVRKLVQKSICKPEDQAEGVRLLLEKTKDKILNQDVPISVTNMRAVGKAAAKDLLKEIKLQGGQISTEDQAFQEAMVKHINNHLRNFLFGPKKTGLSRLCAAVGRFFCAQ